MVDRGGVDGEPQISGDDPKFQNTVEKTVSSQLL